MNLIIKDHRLKVPLDYNCPKSGKIEISARLVNQPGNENRDIFVFLQGGPGFAVPPAATDLDSFKEILKTHRLLLLDQRGTGHSAKITPDTAEEFRKSAQLASYFTHFRADSIVRDLEQIRAKLKIDKWYLLGQSWGGFIAFHYLSQSPEAIKGVITCGGVPPLAANNPDQVYEALAKVLARRNREFFREYPAARSTVRRIRDILLASPVRTSSGDVLTAEKFRGLGTMLGRTGGYEMLNRLLDDPFHDRNRDRLSFPFIRQCANPLDFETNPVYAILHESIYCNGTTSNWAAERILADKPAFHITATTPFFTAETVKQSDFRDYPMLRQFRTAAGILARKSDWPVIYNMDRLADNKVPVEAMVYRNDLFVDFGLTMATLENTGQSRAYVHDSWEHDSLRLRGKTLMPLMLKRLAKRVPDFTG